MLDKATTSLSEKKEEENVSTYVPTPAQLEMIEAEGFETAKFVSHRTAGKVRYTRRIADTVENPLMSCDRKWPMLRWFPKVVLA